RRLPRRAAGALLGLTLLLACVPAAHAARPPADFRPFAPDSIWNLPLRDDVPLHPHSARWSAAFATAIDTANVWINGTTCGMPSYWAPPGTPTVRVTLAASAYQDKGLLRAWSAVPIPDDARPANCSDRNLAVLQRQPD